MPGKPLTLPFTRPRRSGVDARTSEMASEIESRFFVVAGSDHVVRPLFISGRAQISTLPVFLGRAGGLSAFGPIGMVLGPLIVALVLALLRFAEESRQPAVTVPGADR